MTYLLTIDPNFLGHPSTWTSRCLSHLPEKRFAKWIWRTSFIISQPQPQQQQQQQEEEEEEEEEEQETTDMDIEVQKSQAIELWNMLKNACVKYCEIGSSPGTFRRSKRTVSPSFSVVRWEFTRKPTKTSPWTLSERRKPQVSWWFSQRLWCFKIPSGLVIGNHRNPVGKAGT